MREISGCKEEEGRKLTFAEEKVQEEGKVQLLAKVHCRLPSIRARKRRGERIVELLDVELFKAVHVLRHPGFWPDWPMNHIQCANPKKESKYENNIKDIEHPA